jgi:hypothetical protein
MLNAFGDTRPEYAGEIALERDWAFHLPLECEDAQGPGKRRLLTAVGICLPAGRCQRVHLLQNINGLHRLYVRLRRKFGFER